MEMVESFAAIHTYVSFQSLSSIGENAGNITGRVYDLVQLIDIHGYEYGKSCTIQQTTK